MVKGNSWLLLLCCVALMWPAVAEDTGLTVPENESSIKIDGHEFEIMSVTDALAGESSAKLKSLIYPTPQLENCRVIRAQRKGVADAPEFFLGMCSENVENEVRETDYCLNSREPEFTIQGSWPRPTTPSALALAFSDCLLQTCSDGSCE